MRLNKFLATAGIASRRAADELIKNGQVKINGKVVHELGTTINEERDVVEVGNKKIELKQVVTTYILNKPRGVITTAHDPEGRKTVLDFVPADPRVFPCGRLDEDTQGLVILTNDGNLCYQLTHPKFEHQKEYIVHGHSKNPQESLAKMEKGTVLKDGPIKPDKLTVIKVNRDKLEFAITIHEGRNRIVRRFCGAVGIEIDTLTRIKIGKYELGDLKPGEYRKIETK